MPTNPNHLAWIAGGMCALILLCLVPSLALGVFWLAPNQTPTQVAPSPTTIRAVATPSVRPTKRAVTFPQEQAACEAMGGKWGRIGIGARAQCNLPASDANQVCSDSSECEGLCLANLTNEERDRMMRTRTTLETKGKCAPWLITVGCIAVVENGQVKNILCID